jgi:hypothetical protein
MLGKPTKGSSNYYLPRRDPMEREKLVNRYVPAVDHHKRFRLY